MLSVDYSNNWRKFWPSLRGGLSDHREVDPNSKHLSDALTVIDQGTSNVNARSLFPRVKCDIHRIEEEGKDKPGKSPEGINSKGILVQPGPDHSRDTHRMLWKMLSLIHI